MWYINSERWILTIVARLKGDFLVKKRRSGLRALDPGRRTGFSSIIVEPYMQVKLGLFILILNLVFACSIATVFYYYVTDIFDALSLYFKLDEAESLVTWEKLRLPLLVCGSLLIIFLALTLFVTARYTHQIYGPLVSINKFLDNALAGKKPELLKLRSSDQLNELAEKINALYGKSLK